MLSANDSRWQLQEIDNKKAIFTIMDTLAHKTRSYHVPFLRNVEISNHLVVAYTSNSKAMQLDLVKETRRFLSPSELEAILQEKQAATTQALKVTPPPKRARPRKNNTMQVAA